jgi:hypothetical protein
LLLLLLQLQLREGEGKSNVRRDGQQRAAHKPHSSQSGDDFRDHACGGEDGEKGNGGFNEDVAAGRGQVLADGDEENGDEAETYAYYAV